MQDRVSRVDRSIYVLCMMILCTGCGISQLDREQTRAAKCRRTAIRLLDQASGNDECWRRALNRLVFQLAPCAVEEMVSRALRADNLEVRHRMLMLLCGLLRTDQGTDIAVRRALAAEMRGLPDDDAKCNAASLFRLYASKRSFPYMLALLEDPSPKVRMAVIQQLCTVNIPMTISAAEEIAKRLHEEDREVALWTARQMQFLVHAHVSRILREHADKLNDPEVAERARRSAYAINDKMKWQGLPDWAKPPGCNGPGNSGNSAGASGDTILNYKKE